VLEDAVTPPTLRAPVTGGRRTTDPTSTSLLRLKFRTDKSPFGDFVHFFHKWIDKDANALEPTNLPQICRRPECKILNA